ncbi:MAG: Rne/Rng family ribonuclease [Candidatus Eremiobacteraeota bacterium]|nr:Rne/Rng family ribonuclease [Candidatus Eremiobacteraeota bacterium]
MATDILISSDPWENRVAILEDGLLSEIYVEREEKVIGSIYKGKVQNVLPGMGASFVDIGLGRNAFLYVDDINRTPLNIGDVEITQGRPGWSISEKVNRGDDVLVQIVKEPRGLKGARISTNISLPGRYLILMPTGKYSGVSRKIDTAEERNRLKAVMKRIRPEGMATVVRTAAGGVSEAELIADLGVLIRMWHGILEMYKRAPSPSLLHKDMNLVYKAARDFITPEVDRVLIDDAEEFEKVRDFLRLLGPQYLDRLQHYNSGRSLFADFKVDEELQKLMRPKINLPSGGSIVIESTEALTVIDVNSGKFTGGKNLEDTIVRTNVEAAAEIARQVRLRDIGGIIVCDFIDMNTEGSRNKVIATLEGGLRRDRTRATIQSFSALGLLEFTRKRVGKDLSGQLRGPCPTCAGLGSVLSPQSVAIETFRKIRSGNGSDHKHAIIVDTAPTVAAQLEYWYEEECKALAHSLKTPIHVRVDALLHPERTKVRVAPTGLPENDGLRVGDEHEVDVLTTRLPNPTSAATVINGRLIEVENAANAAGQTIRIRIIDVDGENVLAESLAPIAVQDGQGKSRRRRAGQGRKAAVSSQEQTEQLRALAEEAAKTGVDRAAIGISTAAEAEVEQAIDNATVAVAAPVTVASDASGEGAKRRRRRRRRRHPAEVGQSGISRESAQAQLAAPIELASAPQGAAEISVAGAPAAGLPEIQPPSTAGPQPDEVRRKRRRRRRRGRGSEAVAVFPTPAPPVDPVPPDLPPVPDRHIFRVAADGATQATGQTAPPEPSRAIAPWNRKPTPPAVEAPPAPLRAPEEPAKATKPAGRPRRVVAREAAASLESTPVRALPSAQSVPPEPAAPITARKRSSEGASKGAKKATATAKPSKPASKTTRKKSGEGSSAVRKKSAAAKLPARKRKSSHK